MLSLLCVCAMAGYQQATDLVIPAFTAYSVPDHDYLQTSTAGITNWDNPKEAIQWHGLLSRGTLKPVLNVRLPQGQTATLKLTIGDQLAVNRLMGSSGIAPGNLADVCRATVTGKGDERVSVVFPEVNIRTTGYMTFSLTGVTSAGSPLPSIESLTLSGTATVGAQFNLKERRNNASVHLGYPVEKDAQVAWFYNEVTPRLEPLYTYYEVCGFARGYFGMQVNSKTEKRIIFSVWDSGTGNDPNQVSADNRTSLVAKGEGVIANAFGNEGTGGHSHMIYPWVLNKTYRFLVGAKADGTATIYTGYFFDPTQNKWTLIASFRAPKDGKLLRGLYSFDENFGGSTGDLERRAEFGNGWVGTVDGQWTRLVQARFTHDGTGKEDRLDYAAKAMGDRFSLRTGGFLDEPKTDYGTILVRDPKGDQPKDLTLPPLPPR